MVSVYAMLAQGDDTALRLAVHDQDLVRWVYSGFAGDPPAKVESYWHTTDRSRRTAFPCYGQDKPILSTQVSDAVREDFEPHGAFIPVDVQDEGEGAYELYAPTVVVDCLDRERSSEPQGLLEIIEHVVFVAKKVPTAVPAFRIPDSLGFVFWNEWAAKQIVDLVGETDIEVRLVWSDVPGALPHPDPMNI